MSKKYQKQIELEEIIRQQAEVEEKKVQTMPRKVLKPMTDGHKDYMEAIDDCKIIACTGPAGTGKTYIACGMAARYLVEGKIDKIILVRPTVECGKGLGFLPGNVEEKVAVYMIPFFDAFGDFLSKKEIEEFEKHGKIEICPLEYMRGLTLKRSFIILDETQNCTYKQIKMFLTRYGEGSKMVLNGDATQTDLEDKIRKVVKDNYTDFDYACDLLWDINDKDIDVVELTEADIVRHGLVRKIVKAFP